jgi:hypothetical protein
MFEIIPVIKQKNKMINELRVEIDRQNAKINELLEDMKIKSKNAADVFNLRDLYEIKLRDIQNNFDLSDKERDYYKEQ